MLNGIYHAANYFKCVYDDAFDFMQLTIGRWETKRQSRFIHSFSQSVIHSFIHLVFLIQKLILCMRLHVCYDYVILYLCTSECTCDENDSGTDANLLIVEIYFSGNSR